MKLDRTTRRKLSGLGRQMPPEATTPGVTAPASPPAARGPLTIGDPTERHGPLEELLPGTPLTLAEGELYELRLPVSELGEWAIAAVSHWETAARSGRANRNTSPEQTVFFDTETTALSNAPLFLAGLLALEDGEPVIRQLLARDYSEEPAVLAESARRLHAPELVVSYNGTGFDLPYVRDRLRYHRLGPLRVRGHLDLLPVARRRLGRSLGNCKLQTLELHLCGRLRGCDIAGADIPQAYHDFVANGDAWQICRIIEHNAYDVVTLAEIAAHLAD